MQSVSWFSWVGGRLQVELGWFMGTCKQGACCHPSDLSKWVEVEKFSLKEKLLLFHYYLPTCKALKSWSLNIILSCASWFQAWVKAELPSDLFLVLAQSFPSWHGPLKGIFFFPLIEILHGSPLCTLHSAWHTRPFPVWLSFISCYSLPNSTPIQPHGMFCHLVNTAATL